MNFLSKEEYHCEMMLNSNGPLLKRAQESGIPSHVRSMIELSKSNVIPFSINVIKDIFFLKKRKTNLLHVNYLGWRDSIIIAAKVLKIPIVLHCRNEPVVENKTTSSWNISLADRIVTVSKKTKESLNLLPKDYTKAVPIYNAIEVDKFSKGNSIRAELGLKDSDFVVGLIGQLSKRKGVKDFVEMAKLVSEKHSHVQFVVVGEAPAGSQDFANEMKLLGDTFGVAEKIQYTGRRDDVQNIMKSLNVLTVPSYAEPFARVILEAMASSIAVVGSDVSGIPEAVVDGVTGFIIPPGNPVFFAEKINHLVEVPELTQKMGKDAFSRAKDEFDMPILISHISKVYQDLLVN
jgi:glycosyltransferase involved in cell wall biosynthesis